MESDSDAELVVRLKAELGPHYKHDTDYTNPDGSYPVRYWLDPVPVKRQDLARLCDLAERATAERVAVLCTDCGRTAIIPLGEHSMTCTACGGNNVPLEQAWKDEREHTAQLERDLAAARAQLAEAQAALKEWDHFSDYCDIMGVTHPPEARDMAITANRLAAPVLRDPSSAAALARREAEQRVVEAAVIYAQRNREYIAWLRAQPPRPDGNEHGVWTESVTAAGHRLIAAVDALAAEGREGGR